MGVDKARLPIGDQPMAEAVARVLRDAGCDPVFLVRRGPADGLPWREAVIREDEALPRHVLSGFVTAIDAAGGPVCVAACDLVDLTAAGVRAVVDAEAVAWDERPAILGVVGPADRAALVDQIRAGAPYRAWASGRPRVDRPGELRNVNRWEELGVEDPLQRLVRTLGLDGAAAERAIAGERSRLAARGCLLP